MYLKRNKIPKTWPLKRKGTKYLVRTSHDLKNSIPLMIVLRDILKLTTTKKETKKILNLQKVKINNKLIKNEKFPLSIFDNLKLENKKIELYNIKYSLKQWDNYLVGIREPFFINGKNFNKEYYDENLEISEKETNNKYCYIGKDCSPSEEEENKGSYKTLEENGCIIEL